MSEQNQLIEAAREIGKIILGLILILAIFAFIGLCVAVMTGIAIRVVEWMGK